VDLLQGGGGTLGDELKGFHGRALQNVRIYSGTEMTAAFWTWTRGGISE
jgi:hypothetical protein